MAEAYVWDGFLPAGKALTINGQRGEHNLAPEYIQRAIVAVGTPLAEWPNPFPPNPNAGGAQAGQSPIRYLGEVPNNAQIGGPPETQHFQASNAGQSIRIIPYCEYGGHAHRSQVRLRSDTQNNNIRTIILDVNDAYNDQDFNDYKITLTIS